jgi:hypothetical protein
MPGTLKNRIEAQGRNTAITASAAAPATQNTCQVRHETWALSSGPA